MKAQAFYTLFRKHFNPKRSKKVAWAYPGTGKNVTQKQFTKVIDDVILNMSKEAGYHNLKEVDVGNRRPDYKWENENDEIFIEHENIFDTVFENEVPNLLNCDGSLRVLISEITSEEKRTKLRNYVLEKLKERKSGKNFEFLSVLGTDTLMNDYNAWEAYSYAPAFEERKMI